MTAAELLADHGSPLWLADVDRFRANLNAFAAVWRDGWPDVEIAYSYKTNRLPEFLGAAAAAGASAEVTCAAEYELAVAAVELDPSRVVVDGPAKPVALLERAGSGAALVIADSADELIRAAAAGVTRVGLRVALDSFSGARTRFGIPAAEVPAAAQTAFRLGLSVEALSTHLVSTDFDPATGRIVVAWPRAAGEHARAAAVLGGLAAALARRGHEITVLDLGGGLPSAPGCGEHVRAVAQALRGSGFRGRVLLEPGRALAGDAVQLAFTVVAVKTLADGTRCLVCDAGTNFLPGAMARPPRLRAEQAVGPARPALVTGPLCLNVDVIHPAAQLPALRPGSVLVAEAVGAYQQVACTQFGEPPPAVVVRQDGRWSAPRQLDCLEGVRYAV
jgi:diaminopimelate decarboxylase